VISGCDTEVFLAHTGALQVRLLLLLLRVICAEMAGDGLGQTAYDFFSIECTFLRI